MADIELVIKIPTAIYEASQILDVKYEDTIQIPLEVIANATPLTESDDCVSREAVIKLVKKGEYDITGKTDNEMFLEEVNKLPSVQPKQNKGDEEIIKETVESIWGKPPYTEVPDSIKAEIEQYQADCNLSCSDDANCRICDKITFDTIYRIIDKYRKGNKE